MLPFHINGTAILPLTLKFLSGLLSVFLHFKSLMSRVLLICFYFINLSKDISRKIYITPLTRRMRNYLGLEVFLFFFPPPYFSAILSPFSFKNKKPHNEMTLYIHQNGQIQNTDNTRIITSKFLHLSIFSKCPERLLQFKWELK